MLQNCDAILEKLWKILIYDKNRGVYFYTQLIISLLQMTTCLFLIYRSGAGGSRTRVQTCCKDAFYMFSLDYFSSCCRNKTYLQHAYLL